MIIQHIYFKIIIGIVIFAVFVFGQDSLTVYNLDEDIVVTASRIPTHFPSVSRSVIIIDQKQIKQSGITDVSKLLENFTGIDLQQRGEQGVQADLNIRGATFKQSLILIDGVKMSDPQTGHHVMNIPLTVNDIQKIEILKGQGSRLYGPNAFGGVINLITKKNSNTEVSVLNMLGENKFYERSFSLSIPMFSGGHRVSLSQKASDGYRDNTDFKIKTTSYGFDYKVGKNRFSILSGLTDKKFGANSFYTSLYPNQWEHTHAAILRLGAEGEILSTNYSTNIYHRYHTDDFMLNRDNPSFYHNKHYTHVSGFDLHFSKATSFGNTSIGSEIIRESIESNNLGSHRRFKMGLFLEHQLLIKHFQATLGTSLYKFSDWGWQTWPGLDLGYNLTEKINFYGSVGYAFRIPTYTELYYSDPTTQGNKYLESESGWNYELGCRYTNAYIFSSIALFKRDGENLIDLVLMPDSIWHTMNLNRVITNGLELNVSYRKQIAARFIGLNSLNLGYTYLDSDKNTFGQTSKYVFEHLRHNVVIGMNVFLFSPDLQLNTVFRYENRVDYGNRYFMDAQLSWQTGKFFKLHLKVSNIFNNIYEDFHSIPLPGRWIKGGISFNLKPEN